MHLRKMSERLILELLKTIRQNTVDKSDQFVLDFLNIWYEIHQNAKNATLEDTVDICKSLLSSHILPFYEEYKDNGDLSKQEGWIESFASLYLTWGEGGGLMFPLRLVAYEISNHKKSIFYTILNKLQADVMNLSKDELFEIIFPLLLNYVVPLDEIDIQILKGHQSIQSLKTLLYKNPDNRSLAELLQVSTRTIIRRLKVIRFLQLVQPNHFLDMGALGYETLLVIHPNDIPEEYVKYLLLSGNMDIGIFSIIQVPSSQIQIQIELQEQLAPLMYEPMVKRTSTWNISGLSAGDELWTTPPSFLSTKPQVAVNIPSPDLGLFLRPSFDSFRKLSRADYKLLDFLVQQGNFRNYDQLSKAIKVNRMEISQRLKEYEQSNLIFKTYQFYNIGLDLSFFFFISDTDSGIPWLSHLQTFPKVDVFYQQETTPHYYFGYVKLPLKWVKPFIWKVDQIRKNFDVKFYYKGFSMIDHFKWGISLEDTQ